MTFDEFFLKKKIDLAALKRAKPDLYEEFHVHYHQMGEKSFDHTKKFWFNRLRKNYLLKDEGIPTAAKPVKETPIDTEKKAPSAAGSAPKPTGFKPRFKAAVKPAEEPTEPSKADTPAEAQKAAAPTGFKPRFKATAKPSSASSKTNPEAMVDESHPNPPPPSATDTSKPPLGFKPRFKAASPGEPPSPDVPADKAIAAGEETGTPAKPLGFKPRFKSVDPAPTDTDKPAADKAAGNKGTEPAENAETPTKPLGFKPRFKPGGQSSGTEAPKQAGAEPTTPKENKPEETQEKGQEEPAKPLGFKPRFKPGITKPKKD